MYDKELTARVRSIKSTVSERQAGVIRVDELSLQLAFTKDVAAGIGQHAAQLQQQLQGDLLESAHVKIGKTALVRLCNSDQGCIEVRGRLVKGHLQGPTKQGADPTMKLVMIMATEDAPHLWCLHHLSESVKCKINPAQLDLPGITDAGGDNGDNQGEGGNGEG